MKENEKRKPQRENSSDLRRKAEKTLKSETTIEKLSEEEVRKLAHELQAQQIDLEMQNEELRNAQIQIEESRQKYSRLYDFAPVGYFTVSERGIILEVNFTGASMLGIERGLLIKQPLSKFMSEEDANKYYLHQRTVHAEKTYKALEIKMVKKDGTEFHAQLACTAIQDEGDNPRQCLIVITDITERKETDKKLRELNDTLEKCVDERTKRLSEMNNALKVEIIERQLIEIARQESEERYRVIFEQAVDAIVVVNSYTGEIVDFNRHAHENLGYTREEFKKMKLSDIDVIESQEDVTNHIKRIKLKGFDIFEAKQKTKKGKIRHVLISAKVLAIPGKNLILGIWHDITEMKKSEDLLKEQKKVLVQKNIALHEVLGQIEIEKKQLKDNVTANAENLMLPVIQKLKLKGESHEYLQLLENNLLELTSSFGIKLTGGETKLSSREVEICNMIRNGLANKEVASILNISLLTIEKHRAHIRKKLGIVNKRYNLSTFLKQL